MSSYRGRRRYKRKHKKKLVLVADFETTTDPDDCRVWGYGLENIHDPGVEYGSSIDEFMFRIDDQDSVIYFHNLRFDGHFVLDWLLKNQYHHVTAKFDVPPGCFKSLISDQGKFYSITVRLFSGVLIEFRDSLKKLPFRVARIAQTFHLENMKGEIDYDKHRPVDYQMDEVEKKYIENDVSIVSQAMSMTLMNGQTKLTIGADALAEYKNLLGEQEFKRLFPVFNVKLDTEIRRAYRGGFTYADPRFMRTMQGAGQVFDVNSLYPSVMYYQPMPYGEPEFVEGFVEPTPRRPLTIFSVTFTARIKNKHVPCIQIKGSSSFHPTEYLRIIENPTTLMVTNVDWQLMNDHYDIDVLEFGGGWRFMASEGFFADYIDKWMKIKENSSGGEREISKLMLNSLYGKFATNPNVTGKIPMLDETGRVIFKRGMEETRPPVYTPVGVFITSYARDLTVRAAQQHFDHFAYADTDSLHLLTTDPVKIDVDPQRMGAWKKEYDFVQAKFLRPKAYMEKHADGTYTNRIAGVPEHVSAKLTFSDVRPGVVLHGKMVPKSVPGGVVLVPTPYELNY